MRVAGCWAAADGRRFIAGLFCMAVILFGQQRLWHGDGLGPARSNAANTTGPSNVIVVLDFMPERFHNERVAEYGTFAGRDGALNRLRLRFVSPDNLRALSRCGVDIADRAVQVTASDDALMMLRCSKVERQANERR